MIRNRISGMAGRWLQASGFRDATVVPSTSTSTSTSMRDWRDWRLSLRLVRSPVAPVGLVEYRS